MMALFGYKPKWGKRLDLRRPSPEGVIPLTKTGKVPAKPTQKRGQALWKGIADRKSGIPDRKSGIPDRKSGISTGKGQFGKLPTVSGVEQACEPVKKRNNLFQKRISRSSDSGRRRSTAYNARVRVWKTENPRCLFPGCAKKTKDCHHTRGKLGDLLLSEDWWAPLCRNHHDWVGMNIEKARHIVIKLKNGREIPLICGYGEWNSPPVCR